MSQKPLSVPGSPWLNVSSACSRFRHVFLVSIDWTAAIAVVCLGAMIEMGEAHGQSITIANAGFETPSMGTGGGAYTYARFGGLTIADQGGSGWSFSQWGTGFAANGSAFNVVGAFGNQAAFLQNEPGKDRPRIWQDIAGFQRGVGYQLSFYGEYRNALGAGNPLQVRIGEEILQIGGETVFTPPTGTSFSLLTSNPFTAASGTVTLSFEGVFTGAEDRTSFIDNVAISQWVQPGSYWAPGSGAGGSGTWNVANTVWSSAADGNTGKASWTEYSQANVAHFGGAAGTVAVSGTVSVNQLTFDKSGYVISGGAGNAILLNGYNPVVELASNVRGTISAPLQGTAGLNVTGTGTRGTLTLGGSNSYTGGTTVTNALLSLSGTVQGNVSLATSAALGGSGRVNGTVSGAGSVNPGNSPGILTVESVNPSEGLDFTLEFSGTAPNYGNASSSVNDVLRLTGSTPFTTGLTSANTKTLFLNFTKEQLALGTVLEGGFFTNLATDFTSLLNNQTSDNAGFQVYVLGDGDGTDNSLNGVGYYNWRNASMFGWNQSLFMSTVPRTADFGSGNVDGQVMLLTVAVPEPSTYAMALAGIACGGLSIWRRRKRA